MTAQLDRVVVEAPATSANLGPGFDVFALALKSPLDKVEMSLEGSGPLRTTLEVKGGSRVPGNLRDNAVGAVVTSMAKKFQLKGKLSIRLTKGVPVGIGLGSSGASSAGAAVGVMNLFGLEIGSPELAAHAGRGELVASGSAHLDNVTASILGGFVVVPGRPGVRAVRFEPLRYMHVVAVTPKVSLPKRKTEFARSLLPAKVELGDMVTNLSRVSLMVAGFASQNIEMIGEAMEDAVVEPARARMSPGLDDARRAAMEAGAAGACLSGAGPTVLAVVDRKREDPNKVLQAMTAMYEERGTGSSGFVTSMGDGARVVESH